MTDEEKEVLRSMAAMEVFKTIEAIGWRSLTVFCIPLNKWDELRKRFGVHD